MEDDDFIAAYFESMSSLSGKVARDVNAVKAKIHEENKEKKLTFDEECALVNKELIDQVILKAQERWKETEKNKGDELLDTNSSSALVDTFGRYEDHSVSLLLEACNGYVTSNDGNSYRSYTQSGEAQSKRCSLLKLLKMSRVKNKSRNIKEINVKDRTIIGNVYRPSNIVNYRNELNETEGESKSVEQGSTTDPSSSHKSGLIAELHEKFKQNEIDKGAGVKRPGRPNKPKAPAPPPPTSNTSNCAIDCSDSQVLKCDSQGKKPCSKHNENHTGNQDFSEHPDFFVDVSSPCKIATPKTGLEFLDNW